MKIRLAAHAALIVSLSVGFATTGFAHSTGITGASGKSSGFFCNGCHVSGTAPTVAFDGPTTMDPGTTATFSFTVASHSASQIAAGLDVAASGGTLVAGQGTFLLGGEVTHSSPKTNDATGQTTFEFTWQAPGSDGIYTLFGAGASVNGNALQTGDRAARTTYEIYVGVSTPTPANVPPTPTPTPTATATPSGATCVGDCGSDGDVTIDELITGVNMALGVTPLSACPVFDANRDAEVTIDEILQAVNSAQNGCPV